MPVVGFFPGGGKIKEASGSFTALASNQTVTINLPFEPYAVIVQRDAATAYTDNFQNAALRYDGEQKIIKNSGSYTPLDSLTLADKSFIAYRNVKTSSGETFYYYAIGL